MSKKYLFGVPNTVFLLIVLGVIGVFLILWLVDVAVIPVVGYYLWQTREKNRELERRIAALEGHGHS
jgi:hypothetical protein